MANLLSDFDCTFEVKSEDEKAATFSGIASTSDVDLVGDIIEPGAFDPIRTKTCPGGTVVPDVVMLRDHDRTEIIGGWRSFRQQGKHLHVEGELALEVSKARETHALMKRGYLSGLSVGFSVPDPNQVVYDGKTQRRHIKKAILRECSIVAFPANPQAKIVTVKSEIDDWMTEHGLSESDLMELLREATKYQETPSISKGGGLFDKITEIDGHKAIDDDMILSGLRGLLSQVKGYGHV